MNAKVSFVLLTLVVAAGCSSGPEASDDTVGDCLCQPGEYMQCECPSGTISRRYCSQTCQEWHDCECLGESDVFDAGDSGRDSSDPLEDGVGDVEAADSLGDEAVGELTPSDVVDEVTVDSFDNDVCVPRCEGECAGHEDGCGGFCDANDCSGCCDDAGDCRPGLTSSECGASGESCVTCDGSLVCVAGECCECESGGCCDGCNILPQGTECGSPVVERQCDVLHGVCGAPIQERSTPYLCDGVSPICLETSVGATSEWMEVECCDSDEACDTVSTTCIQDALCSALGFEVLERRGKYDSSIDLVVSPSGVVAAGDTVYQAVLLTSSGVLQKRVALPGSTVGIADYVPEFSHLVMCPNSGGIERLLIVDDAEIFWNFDVVTGEQVATEGRFEHLSIACVAAGDVVSIEVAEDRIQVVQRNIDTPDQVVREYDLPAGASPTGVRAAGGSSFVIYGTLASGEHFHAGYDVGQISAKWVNQYAESRPVDSMSPGGTYYMASSSSDLYVYDTTSGELVNTFLGATYDPDWVSDTEIVYSGINTNSNRFTFKNVVTSADSRTGFTTSFQTDRLTVDRGHQTILTMDNDGRLYALSFTGATKWTNAYVAGSMVAPHSAGQNAFAAGMNRSTVDDGFVVYDVATMASEFDIVEATAMDSGVDYVSVSDDGSMIAMTGSVDTTCEYCLKIYSVSTGTQKCQYSATERIDNTYPAWSPDGSLIALPNDDGKVTIVKSSNCSFVRSLQLQTTTNDIKAMKFLDNSRLIVSWRGFMKTVNVSDGSVITNFVMNADGYSEFINIDRTRGLLLAEGNNVSVDGQGSGLWNLDSGEILSYFPVSGNEDSAALILSAADVIYDVSHNEIYDFDGRLLLVSNFLKDYEGEGAAFQLADGTIFQQAKDGMISFRLVGFAAATIAGTLAK